jgi:predicted esterase
MNCNDDPIVHYHNAELLDSALTANNIPHHYEHYETGGHGFGATAAKTTPEAIVWKERFLEWLYALIGKD